jgi:hypothetical protein
MSLIYLHFSPPSGRLHLCRSDDPVTFSCPNGRGALSYLPFSGERKGTVARDDFGRWTTSNISNCMRLARHLGLGDTQMEDIILVTGCHLTRSWVNVTFSRNQGPAHVKLGIRRSADSEVDFDEWEVNGGDVKFGPRGKVSWCFVATTLRNHGP